MQQPQADYHHPLPPGRQHRGVHHDVPIHLDERGGGPGDDDGEVGGHLEVVQHEIPPVVEGAGGAVQAEEEHGHDDKVHGPAERAEIEPDCYADHHQALAKKLHRLPVMLTRLVSVHQKPEFPVPLVGRRLPLYKPRQPERNADPEGEHPRRRHHGPLEVLPLPALGAHAEGVAVSVVFLTFPHLGEAADGHGVAVVGADYKVVHVAAGAAHDHTGLSPLAQSLGSLAHGDSRQHPENQPHGG
mmetsp:Transcript_12844/g.32047  ORF Transcript_12844/g.32047 Transcript_12844/m.32047 type:complete len:243 (+) Transcript_12844:135-863(+)